MNEDYKISSFITNLFKFEGKIPFWSFFFFKVQISVLSYRLVLLISFIAFISTHICISHAQSSFTAWYLHVVWHIAFTSPRLNV
jgi:hypothetical protein